MGLNSKNAAALAPEPETSQRNTKVAVICAASLALVISIAAFALPSNTTSVGQPETVAQSAEVERTEVQSLEPVSVAVPVVPAHSVEAQVENNGGDDLMKRMMAGTIAALQASQVNDSETGATPEPVAAAAASELLGMVIAASAQGQSQTYIDQLVNDAYARGDVSVPESLILADGRVDTVTILNLLGD